MDIENGVVYLDEYEKRALAGKNLPDPLTPADVQKNIDDWLAGAGEKLDDLQSRHALDEDPNVSREVAQAEEARDVLIGMAGAILAYEAELSL